MSAVFSPDRIYRYRLTRVDIVCAGGRHPALEWLENAGYAQMRYGGASAEWRLVRVPG